MSSIKSYWSVMTLGHRLERSFQL